MVSGIFEDLIARLLTLTGIFNNIITPRMVVTTAWNWRAKAAFFWAGSCLLCIVWVYFRLPEPKGRTYAELDMLFERKVKARDFSKIDANLFVTSSGHENDKKSITDVSEKFEVAGKRE